MTKRLIPMALAIMVVLGAGARTASAEPFIFGFTGGVADAVVLVVNSGAQTFSISDSQFDAGVNNAGWWSGTFTNDDANDNYFVGSVDLGGDLADLRNFFTFDLAQLGIIVTDAELRIARSGPGDTSGGFGTVPYTLWDVTTDTATLNSNDGTDAGIYTDLGTGITYGSILVDDTDGPDPLVIALNQDAIDAINRRAGEFFSIGGALPAPVPEPASLALLLLGGGAAAFRARRRRSN
jgi:hypothetical protein